MQDPNSKANDHQQGGRDSKPSNSPVDENGAYFMEETVIRPTPEPDFIDEEDDSASR